MASQTLKTVLINGNTYEPRRDISGRKLGWQLVCVKGDALGRTYRFESEAKRAAFVDAWTKVNRALTALDSVFVAGLSGKAAC